MNDNTPDFAAIRLAEPPVLAMPESVFITGHDDGDIVIRIGTDDAPGDCLLIAPGHLRTVTLTLLRVLMEREGETL